jgi:P-type conjugative transfer protein TrbJ
MNQPSGRWRACLVLSTAVSVVSATPMQAQLIVEDPWNLTYNTAQYLKQIDQIAMQIEQLNGQLQDMRHLASFPGRNVEALLNQVSGLLGQSQSLGYAAANVGGTFDQYFTPSQVAQRWAPSRQAQAQAALDVMQAAVVATNRQQDAVAPAEVAIAGMKRLNTGLVGQQQALELQNSAAVYSAEELTLLRQAAMLQTNIEAVYDADRLAREAQRDTTITAMLTTLAAPVMAAPSMSLSLP